MTEMPMPVLTGESTAPRGMTTKRAKVMEFAEVVHVVFLMKFNNKNKKMKKILKSNSIMFIFFTFTSCNIQILSLILQLAMLYPKSYEMRPVVLDVTSCARVTV